MLPSLSKLGQVILRPPTVIPLRFDQSICRHANSQRIKAAAAGPTEPRERELAEILSQDLFLRETTLNCHLRKFKIWCKTI